MMKGIIWGMGKCFREHWPIVKYFETINHFEILGITSNDSLYSEIRGYKYINKNQIEKMDIDFVIIMAYDEMLKEIREDAEKLGINKEHIFSYRVLYHHKFDIERYFNIRRNPPSIFANNCWGGLTYHSLDLEFTSPLVNMFESQTDYMKLLKNPKWYMNEELHLLGYNYEQVLKIDYPVVACGDIKLYFNHYDSFEIAKEKWEKRKHRIDWDNLFVMMWTEDYAIASEFVKLPYKKKICFVPFYSEEKELIHIEFHNKNQPGGKPFKLLVNDIANGVVSYYDVFDLIEQTKFTKVVDRM